MMATASGTRFLRPEDRPRWRTNRLVMLVLVVQGLLLGWNAIRTSPTADESGHLAGGIYSWTFGRFDVYRVNPPLVRSVAALPVVLTRPRNDWSHYRNGTGERPEWRLGRDFVQANSERAFLCFTLARWACIPLLMLGGWVCWRWASDLYGQAAGLTAALLWCLSPNVLAWGSTICPDAPAASIGVAACYVFWKWLQAPRWDRAMFAGATLGLAELTKMTWIVLFVAWPLLMLLWELRFHRDRIGRVARAGQSMTILVVSVHVMNLGYAFEGCWTRLDDYTFVSRTLADDGSLVGGGNGGNRFRGTWLGRVPVPFPENYLKGMDLQAHDFEERKWSYLASEWKHGGWWHFYLYVALVKVPLGIWCLASMALALRLSKCFRQDDRRSGIATTPSGGCIAPWLNEFTLLLPAALVFLLVSSQTGFTIYFRYVLPCFPFLFIWISSAVRSWRTNVGLPRLLAIMALVWSLASSLWCYPHSMSYFNELVGGPMHGHHHLIDANMDWGQDLHFLKQWYDDHPAARPLHLEHRFGLDAECFGIEETKQVPGGPSGRNQVYSGADCGASLGPHPGWYAISVTRIHSRRDHYLYFLELDPVATAGYSIYIYHITIGEANRVRAKLGLPSWDPQGDSATKEEKD